MFETIHEILLSSMAVEKLIDGDDFLQLITRLAINLGFTWVIVRGIYVRLYQWNQFVFTYLSFNLVTFALCFLLRKVPIELGFALGLFAVFGILRYRTEAVGIRDLTYLFLVIAVAILNAVANKKVSAAEILTINVVVVMMVYLLEFRQGHRRLDERSVVYDNLELIQEGRRSELKTDLESRTGLSVAGVRVERVDLLRDTAIVTVFCCPENSRQFGS